MKIKTAIGAMRDVIDVIKGSSIQISTGMTGDVFITSRPLSSKAEDIVINCPAAGAEQVTQILININTHVPNLSMVPSGGAPNAIDKTQPDLDRMEEIGALVMEVFRNYRGFDFFTRLENRGEVMPDGKGGHFYNVLIWYTYLQR